MYMTDLDTLKEQAVAFRDERDWKQFHNPKDMAISLSLEASEFLEHFLWKNEKEIEEFLRTHKQKVEDELADVVFNVLLLSNDLEIDLGKALENKLAEIAKKYPVEKSKGKNTKYTEL